MYCVEVKVGEKVQIGDITISTQQTSSYRKTRVYIDAPESMAITRIPATEETRPRRLVSNVKVMSETVVS